MSYPTPRCPLHTCRALSPGCVLSLPQRTPMLGRAVAVLLRTHLGALPTLSPITVGCDAWTRHTQCDRVWGRVAFAPHPAGFSFAVPNPDVGLPPRSQIHISE